MCHSTHQVLLTHRVFHLAPTLQTPGTANWVGADIPRLVAQRYRPWPEAEAGSGAVADLGGDLAEAGRVTWLVQKSRRAECSSAQSLPGKGYCRISPGYARKMPEVSPNRCVNVVLGKTRCVHRLFVRRC